MEAEHLGARFFALEFPVDWISKLLKSHSIEQSEARDYSKNLELNITAGVRSYMR